MDGKVSWADLVARWPSSRAEAQRHLFEAPIPLRDRCLAWMAMSGARELKTAHEGEFERLCAQEVPQAGMIAKDLARTFSLFDSTPGFSTVPEAHVRGFPRTRAQKFESLERLLRAYAAWNPGIGYHQGMNFIAALLLLQVGDEECAFWTMVAVLHNWRFVKLFDTHSASMQRYVDAFARRLATQLPDVHAHFSATGFSTMLYALEWFTTLFCYSLNLEAAVWVFDLLLSGLEECVFRTGMAMLVCLRPKLLRMEFPALMGQFKHLSRLLPAETLVPAIARCTCGPPGSDVLRAIVDSCEATDGASCASCASATECDSECNHSCGSKHARRRGCAHSAGLPISRSDGALSSAGERGGRCGSDECDCTHGGKGSGGSGEGAGSRRRRSRRNSARAAAAAAAAAVSAAAAAAQAPLWFRPNIAMAGNTFDATDALAAIAQHNAAALACELEKYDYPPGVLAALLHRCAWLGAARCAAALLATGRVPVDACCDYDTADAASERRLSHAAMDGGLPLPLFPLPREATDALSASTASAPATMRSEHTPRARAAADSAFLALRHGATLPQPASAAPAAPAASTPPATAAPSAAPDFISPVPNVTHGRTRARSRRRSSSGFSSAQLVLGMSGGVGALASVAMQRSRSPSPGRGLLPAAHARTAAAAVLASAAAAAAGRRPVSAPVTPMSPLTSPAHSTTHSTADTPLPVPPAVSAHPAPHDAAAAAAAAEAAAAAAQAVLGADDASEGGHLYPVARPATEPVFPAAACAAALTPSSSFAAGTPPAALATPAALPTTAAHAAAARDGLAATVCAHTGGTRLGAVAGAIEALRHASTVSPTPGAARAAAPSPRPLQPEVAGRGEGGPGVTSVLPSAQAAAEVADLFPALGPVLHSSGGARGAEGAKGAAPADAAAVTPAATRVAAPRAGSMPVLVGMTALHVAALFNRASVARVLLAFGANAAWRAHLPTPLVVALLLNERAPQVAFTKTATAAELAALRRSVAVAYVLSARVCVRCDRLLSSIGSARKRCCPRCAVPLCQRCLPEHACAPAAPPVPLTRASSRSLEEAVAPDASAPHKPEATTTAAAHPLSRLVLLPEEPDQPAAPPRWVPDQDAWRCRHCDAVFTTFTRRHHCRRCCAVFCSACSEFRCALPPKFNSPVRLCRTCQHFVRGCSCRGGNPQDVLEMRTYCDHQCRDGATGQLCMCEQCQQTDVVGAVCALQYELT